MAAKRSKYKIQIEFAEARSVVSKYQITGDVKYAIRLLDILPTFEDETMMRIYRWLSKKPPKKSVVPVELYNIFMDEYNNRLSRLEKMGR